MTFTLAENFAEMASRSTLRNTDPKKVSGELFALTYGGLVSTLLKDYENVDDVNKQVGVNLINIFFFYFQNIHNSTCSLIKWDTT